MHEDRYFDRSQAARYLRERWGLRISRSTLAKYAVWGCGPRFFKPGPTQVVYARSELDRWARERLGRPCASTSDAETPRTGPVAEMPQPHSTAPDRPPQAAPESTGAAITAHVGSICGRDRG